MKARLPYEYRHGREGARRRAVATAILLFAKALRDYGMSIAKINEWMCWLSEATAELAGYSGSGFSNRTWGDEIDYWADALGLEIPKGEAYRLIIPGGHVAHGDERRRLVLCELYALRCMGYGKVRLKRVLDTYAAVSGLRTDGRAKYTKDQLESWADASGVVR